MTTVFGVGPKEAGSESSESRRNPGTTGVFPLHPWNLTPPVPSEVPSPGRVRGPGCGTDPAVRRGLFFGRTRQSAGARTAESRGDHPTQSPSKK